MDETVYDIQGFKMYLDEHDSLGLKKNPEYDIHEINLIKSVVGANDVVVDVGANIGYYTLLMAERARLVYAFEPDLTNFEILIKNIKLNGMTNVTAYNFAVGPNHGTVPLNLCTFNSGMHRIYQSEWCKGDVVHVSMVPLNNIVKHVDFIKMDIEGSEFGALQGAEDLIKNSRPIMLMEFHPPGIEEYGVNPVKQFNYIRNLGYRISLLGIHGYEDVMDISVDDLIIETRNYPGRNILCVPV